MLKPIGFYKWIQSNVEYGSDPATLISVGGYQSTPNTLYGNYQKYCIENNYPKIGLAKFSRLIIEYFSNLNLPVKEMVQNNRKFIQHVKFVDSTYPKEKEKIITNLKSPKKVKENIGVIDIETVSNAVGVQVPYAIGYRLVKKDKGFNTKIYYIKEYGEEIITASKLMIKAFLEEFLEKGKGYHIYLHNLGSFDGYLLFKPLFELVGVELKVLIDDFNQIISMQLPKHKIDFRDSLRIFPLNLLKLSELFNVPIQKGELDHQEVTVERIYEKEFKREVLEYLNKDLISLLDVMKKGTDYIFNNYGVDLSKTYSTSNLAIRIFRTSFLNVNIPLLNRAMDTFIRKSYLGGITEVYKVKGKNLYNYDVNSLYPAAMIKPIPFEFKRIIEGGEIDLNRFFGFIYATVYCPKSVKVPVLPWRDPVKGRIQCPYGLFTGYYFSEELKAVKSIGYKITPLLGYEFSQKLLFNNYVEHFYEKKSKTNGSERFITKLLLNGLYGYFGRKIDRFNLEFLDSKSVDVKLATFESKAMIEMDDNTLAVLIKSKPDPKLVELFGFNYLDLLQEFTGFTPKILTNVSIASAVTSYARILMIPVKTDPINPCYYTDTDSVFVGKPLNSTLVGINLGQFKDELQGFRIDKALFLAPKTYGYIIGNKSKTVVAGVRPGIINYTDLESIYKGNTIEVNNNIINKSLTNLTLTFKSNTIQLSLKTRDLVKTPIYNSNFELIGYLPKNLWVPHKLYKLQCNYKKIIKELKKHRYIYNLIKN